MSETQSFERDDRKARQHRTEGSHPQRSDASLEGSASYEPALQTSLLGDPLMTKRGNGAAHTVQMAQAQRLHGNRSVQRFLNRSATAAPYAEGEDETGEVDIASRIEQKMGRGSPLGGNALSRLEAGLGASLGHVRVHTDPEADHLARSVESVAFTSGADIFFRSGSFDPGTEEGMYLLAHEATHTLQQAAGPVAGTPNAGWVSISDPSDMFEQDAHRSALRAVLGDSHEMPAASAISSPGTAPGLQGRMGSGNDAASSDSDRGEMPVQRGITDLLNTVTDLFKKKPAGGNAGNAGNGGNSGNAAAVNPPVFGPPVAPPKHKEKAHHPFGVDALMFEKWTVADRENPDKGISSADPQRPRTPDEIRAGFDAQFQSNVLDKMKQGETPEELGAWKDDYAKIMELMMNKGGTETALKPLDDIIEGNKVGGAFGDRAMGTAVDQHLGDEFGFSKLANAQKIPAGILDGPTFVNNLLGTGLVPKDPGAGLTHGEWSHPLQWSAISSQFQSDVEAKQAGKEDAPNWSHVPLELLTKMEDPRFGWMQGYLMDKGKTVQEEGYMRPDTISYNMAKDAGTQAALPNISTLVSDRLLTREAQARGGGLGKNYTEDKARAGWAETAPGSKLVAGPAPVAEAPLAERVADQRKKWGLDPSDEDDV